LKRKIKYLDINDYRKETKIFFYDMINI